MHLNPRYPYRDYTLNAHRYNLPPLGTTIAEAKDKLKSASTTLLNASLPPAGLASGAGSSVAADPALKRSGSSASVAAVLADEADPPLNSLESDLSLKYKDANPFMRSESARQYRAPVGHGPLEPSLAGATVPAAVVAPMVASADTHVVSKELLVGRFRAMVAERGIKAFFTFYQLIRQSDRQDCKWVPFVQLERVLRHLRMVLDPRELHSLHHFYDPDGRDVFFYDNFFLDLKRPLTATEILLTEALFSALADKLTATISMDVLRANFQNQRYLHEFLEISHNSKSVLNKAEFDDFVRALALGFYNEAAFVHFLESSFPYALQTVIVARNTPAVVPLPQSEKDFPVVFDPKLVLESLPSTYYDKTLAATGNKLLREARSTFPLLGAPHIGPHAATFCLDPPPTFDGSQQRSRCISGPSASVATVLETLLEIFKAEAARDPERRVLVRFTYALRNRDASGRGSKCQWEDFEYVLRNGRKWGCDAEVLSSIGIENFARVFAHFDDGSRKGFMDVNNFIIHLRGPIKRSRLDVIDTAFSKLDARRDGYALLNALEREINVSNDPRVMSGRRSESGVIQEFIEYFKFTPVAGKVTLDEFRSYYANVSAVIDDDSFFRLMLWTEWNLSCIRSSEHGRHAPKLNF